MRLIKCSKCGTSNSVEALESRAGKCRDCGKWIMRTEQQIREQVARLDEARRKREAPERRSAAARKAWRTRKLAGKAKPTTEQRLAAARAKVETWQQAVSNAAAKVNEWKRKVVRLEKKIKRDEKLKLPLLIVSGDESSEGLKPHRRYSAD